MKSFNQKLEVFSNFAIIAVALLLAFFLVRNYVFEKKASVSQGKVANGTKIELPKIDFSKNDKTIGVVLQPGCQYCLESKPFYQKLADVTSQTKKASLVLLLSDLAPEGKSFLSENGFPHGNIVQASLKSLGIRVTPYLFVADRSGVVVASWAGKLTLDEEKEVLSMVE